MKLTRLSLVPRFGVVVEQAQAALAQRRAHGVDVGDAVGELLDAGAAAVEELRDRRLGGERREQLDARAGVADAHHRLAHALLLVGLLVQQRHAVRLLVERDGRVEVGHGDADVVDVGEEVRREWRSWSQRDGRRDGIPDRAVCRVRLVMLGEGPTRAPTTVRRDIPNDVGRGLTHDC